MKRLGVRFDTIGFSDNGQVDMDRWSPPSIPRSQLSSSSPQLLGGIEDVGAVSELAHRHGALAIVNVCEAMSFGLLAPPVPQTGTSAVGTSSSVRLSHWEFR